MTSSRNYVGMMLIAGAVAFGWLFITGGFR
jgi:hypothetical protein